MYFVPVTRLFQCASLTPVPFRGKQSVFTLWNYVKLQLLTPNFPFILPFLISVGKRKINSCRFVVHFHFLMNLFVPQLKSIFITVWSSAFRLNNFCALKLCSLSKFHKCWATVTIVPLTGTMATFKVGVLYSFLDAVSLYFLSRRCEYGARRRLCSP